MKDNVCLSGGAYGSDLFWGYNAGVRGDQVIHWSFHGHDTQAPEQEVARLKHSQLIEADEPLKVAAKSLGRSLSGRKDYVMNLFRRNYYQVCYTERVYAVSSFGKHNKVNGGTAWAVQMYLDRFENGDDCEMYLLNQPDLDWWKWDNRFRLWECIDSPPIPHGIWTGIGTRKLSKKSKDEIRKLFQ